MGIVNQQSKPLDNQQPEETPWLLWAWFFALSGIVVRLALAWNSRGTNDIITWERFAQLVDQHGVLWMYTNASGWNHPPLTGYLAAVLWHVSHWLSLPFAFTFKLVPITADACSMLLLWKIWSRRVSPKAGALAVVLFAFSVNAVLVSAYHGNNDSLVAALIIFACYLTEETDRAFIGGLALAAAINIKLIPLVLVPIWFIHGRKSSTWLRTAAGLAVGALPFVPVLWMVGSAFHRKAIVYNSNFDNWGFAFFIRLGEQHPVWQALAAQWHQAFVFLGRYCIIGAIVAVSAWSRWKRRFSLYELAAIGVALFLFFTPGFGVQYTAILGPVLFAVSLRWGAWYGLASGIFLASVYYQFWTRGPLLHSQFTTAFPWPSSAIGLVAWVTLFAFIVAYVKMPSTKRLGS